ncbi:MAG: hypothetical protein AAB281_06705, partial [Actinomycetota bacterium]
MIMYGYEEQIGFPILTLLVFLPALGGLVALLFRRRPDIYKPLMRAFTAATFVLSLVMYGWFDRYTADMQFVESVPWI